MSAPPERPILGQIFAALRRLEEDLTVEEVADAVWLAGHMRRALDVEAAPRLPAGEPGRSGARAAGDEQADAGAQTPSDSSAGRQGLGRGAVGGGRRNDQTAQTVTRPQTALQVPLLSALPETLPLTRSLRPLRRLVRSPYRLQVDEEATAEQMADLGLRAPVLRAASELRFSAVLVVDCSASMRIWRRLAGEVRRMLERSGAFRQIAVASFDSDGSGRPPLSAGMRGDGPPLAPAELFDPTGRRLILVLSDCLGAAWYDGRATELLNGWGERAPTAIVQTLPRWLWRSSALGRAEYGSATGEAPGLPNSRLSWRAAYDDEGPERGAVVPMPALALTPAALRSWARLAMGQGQAGVAAYLLAGEGGDRIPPVQRAAGPKADAAALAAAFAAWATPETQILAGLAAAVPLTLPTIELVARLMQPPAGQPQVAELLMSGLLTVRRQGDEPESTIYDFPPDVRPLLLAGVTTRDAVLVLQRVAAFLAGDAAAALDVQRIVADPESFQPADLPPGPLTEALALVMSRLTVRHQEFARHLDPALPLPDRPRQDSAAEAPAHGPSVAPPGPTEQTADDAPSEVNEVGQAEGAVEGQPIVDGPVKTPDGSLVVLLEAEQDFAHLLTNGRSPSGLPLLTISVGGIAALVAPNGSPTLNRKDIELERVRIRANEPSLGVVFGVDESDVYDARWAVVCHADDDALLIKAIAPLIELRCQQMGISTPDFAVREGETCYAWLKRNAESINAPMRGRRPVPVLVYNDTELMRDWLARHGVSAGPVDPRRGVPYYLLLAGRPGQIAPDDTAVIPYDFQYQLDIFWAVGRVCFTDSAGRHDLPAYEGYARRVVERERRSPRGPNAVKLLGAVNSEDEASGITVERLIRPLATALNANGRFPNALIQVEDGSRRNLERVLNARDVGQRPDVLLTAAHGLGLRLGEPRQPEHQGGLILDSWSGVGNVARDHYFIGEDLSDTADLDGMGAICYGTYSLGCLGVDLALRLPGAPPPDVAPYAFVSRLAQRMLRQGATAVFGMVGRAWPATLNPPVLDENPTPPVQLPLFEELIVKLIAGQRVGAAADAWGQVAASRASELVSYLDDIRFGRTADPVALAQLWMQFNELRAFSLLGDPAARLFEPQELITPR